LRDGISSYVDINLDALGDKDWHSRQLNEILEDKNEVFQVFMQIRAFEDQC
jgi:hypothetical protein